jgi:hypothetical protein
LQLQQNIFAKTFLLSYLALFLSRNTNAMPYKHHIFNVRKIAALVKEKGSKKSNVYEHLNFILNYDSLIGPPEFIDEVVEVVESGCKDFVAHMKEHKKKLILANKEAAKSAPK